MNQFEQYVLASSMLREAPLFRDTRAMRLASRVAMGAAVILAGGLLAIATGASQDVATPHGVASLEDGPAVVEPMQQASIAE